MEVCEGGVADCEGLVGSWRVGGGHFSFISVGIGEGCGN